MHPSVYIHLCLQIHFSDICLKVGWVMLSSMKKTPSDFWHLMKLEDFGLVWAMSMGWHYQCDSSYISDLCLKFGPTDLGASVYPISFSI